jgi:hypothetical protein
LVADTLQPIKALIEEIFEDYFIQQDRVNFSGKQRKRSYD